MSYDPSIEATHMARNILAMMRPKSLVDGRKLRVGRMFDGGYVMVDKFEGITLAYSLGINDDVSWDLDIARRDVDIYQYDHTIDALPLEHPRFHWSKIGISHETGGDVATLESLIDGNGHADEWDMLLKCDIEGWEWMSLAHMPNEVLSHFRQIVIELHSMGDIGDRGSADVARNAIANLTASHHVVHVHANNFGGVSIVGGLAIPDVLELTLLRKDQGTFRPSTEIFPTKIDMPCHSSTADLYLGRFLFDEA